MKHVVEAKPIESNLIQAEREVEAAYTRCRGSCQTICVGMNVVRTFRSRQIQASGVRRVSADIHDETTRFLIQLTHTFLENPCIPLRL